MLPYYSENTGLSHSADQDGKVFSNMLFHSCLDFNGFYKDSSPKAKSSVSRRKSDISDRDRRAIIFIVA